MSDKFEFIDVEYAAYQESDERYVPSIVKMCIWMEVSRSGFYEWRNAPESATARRRGELALYVRKSFGDSDDTYGYRRVHADLVAWGVPAGPELIGHRPWPAPGKRGRAVLLFSHERILALGVDSRAVVSSNLQVTSYWRHSSDDNP